MPGLQTNSLDKIAGVYFAGVASESFEYHGKTYRPKTVVVSPHIFRGATCPMGCGGCCFRFSLAYLPSDPTPDSPYLRPEIVTVGNVSRTIIVDAQQDHQNHFCRHLDRSSGRCGIHGEHPFTCDFELIRFTHQETRCDIATRLFGRGWSYLRVTGQVGSQCDLLPPGIQHQLDAARKLKRLKEWSDYFQIETHLPQIISWVEEGPHEKALVITPRTRTLLSYGK